MLTGVAGGALLGPEIGGMPVAMRTPVGVLVDALRLGFLVGIGLVLYGAYKNRRS